MTGLPAQPAVPAHFQTFLAFDFGLKRTGVASGNRMLRGATPQATIKAEGDARFVQVAQRIKEWQPDALVIGVPYHPDGASHENTERALKFGRQLRGRFGLQVFEVDERYSTTEALVRRRQGCRRRVGLHHPGTVFEESSMSHPSPAASGSLVLDAEALYRELLRGVRSMLTPTTRLAGITSGGAWLAERLQKDLGLEGPPACSRR